MKLVSLFLLNLSFCLNTFGQMNAKSNYNFDFENIIDRKAYGWTHFGSNKYNIGIDSSTYYSGKHAGYISYNGEQPDFATLEFRLPKNYNGSTIKFSGYLKTENVSGGFAGLWMRIDPKIEFYNMNDVGITGNSDWKKYEIAFTLKPNETKLITFGALLMGKGKVWLDNINVSIDGEDIQKLNPIPYVRYPADEDTAFNHGSQITRLKLDPTPIENLKSLCLIWGFLKYYHPNIAAGQFNWDFELIRILPQIDAVLTQSERDSVLLAWIKSLGPFEERNRNESNDMVVQLQPDLDWIQSSNFSEPLTEMLLKLRYAKRNKFHYYISLDPYVKNPIFKNEEKYETMAFPDLGFRILSLFRYWNMIQYFFPYRDIMDQAWKPQLDSFIPKFALAKNTIDYLLCTQAIIGKINDTHAKVFSKHEALNQFYGLRYAPFDVRFIEGKAIIYDTYPCNVTYTSQMKKGDILLKVNGKSIEKIIEARMPYTSGSNRITQLKEIGEYLLRSNDSLIQISYQRGSKIMQSTIQTFPKNEIQFTSKTQRSDTCFKLIHKDLAYLYLGSIKEKYIPKLWEKFKDKKGLIIDLRCYPKEFIVYTLGKYLIGETKAFAKFSHSILKSPGTFVMGAKVYIEGRKEDYYKGKTIILVNENTLSQAEFTAMALSIAPQVKIIGSTTSAADGNVSSISLPGGISTAISGLGVFYPDGKGTQRIGIVPDLIVHPTIKGIRENKDEVLDKAIALLESEIH